MEFPGDGGKFDIENYVEGHNFMVNGSRIPTSNVGEWQTPNTQSTPAPFSSIPSSRVPRRIPYSCFESCLGRPWFQWQANKCELSQFNCTYQFIYGRRGLCIKYATKSTGRND